MKIGIAQINTTVGAFAANARKIRQAYEELCQRGAELVLTPELAVAGYPPRDLLLRDRFLTDARETLDKLAADTGAIPLVVGFPEKNTGPGKKAFNAAAWCVDGKIVQCFHKCLLPTYDVFDEERYFETGQADPFIEFQNRKIAVTICEDLWHGQDAQIYKHESDPLRRIASARPDVILNLSASPWHFGKRKLREEVVARASRTGGCAVVYCNSVGGNDELIFDGHSLFSGADGIPREAASSFVEEWAIVDTEEPRQAPAVDLPMERMEEIRKALVLGLRDYTTKCGFHQAVIGLSGGIDSAVTAVLACQAFGPEHVRGIALPSSISSTHSVSDARELAENLGINFTQLPIASLVEAAASTLEPIFAGTAPNVAEENIQARARGLLLMAVSNKFGEILLTTGNKSEIAVGYCTLYGDMAGGLAVLSDLPKTLVYELARHLNQSRTLIPVSTMEKPPSAELRPDQKDEDSLPPYPVLDRILELYVEKGLSRSEICDEGFDKDLVLDIVRKVDLNEYKRKQAAPGLKITPLAFGIGRRIPIVQQYVH